VTIRPSDPEDGSVLWLAWPGLALVGVVLVLVVDLAAYTVAAGRAQGAADAAALAAVSATHPMGSLGGSPRSHARRLARANGATLRGCVCQPGSESVTVTVGVPVRAIAVTRFAARTAVASAEAQLVPERGPPWAPAR
jgi:uncharacterized membrane protein